MELWAELFSDWVGILSASAIAFTILMAFWFAWYFVSHMIKDSEKKQRER